MYVYIYIYNYNNDNNNNHAYIYIIIMYIYIYIPSTKAAGASQNKSDTTGRAPSESAALRTRPEAMARSMTISCRTCSGMNGKVMVNW